MSLLAMSIALENGLHKESLSEKNYTGRHKQRIPCVWMFVNSLPGFITIAYTSLLTWSTRFQEELEGVPCLRYHGLYKLSTTIYRKIGVQVQTRPNPFKSHFWFGGRLRLFKPALWKCMKYLQLIFTLLKELKN